MDFCLNVKSEVCKRMTQARAKMKKGCGPKRERHKKLRSLNPDIDASRNVVLSADRLSHIGRGGEGAILDFAQNSFARTIFAFTLPLNHKNAACGMGRKYASRQKDPNCLLNKPNMFWYTISSSCDMFRNAAQMRDLQVRTQRVFGFPE